MEIHDRHQIEEDFLQWDGGDVSAPHLINRRDLAWIHQAENRRDGLPGTVVWGFWLIACQPLAAHEVSDTVAADRDPFSGKVGDHPPAATAGIPHQGRYPASEVNDGTCPENQSTSVSSEYSGVDVQLEGAHSEVRLIVRRLLFVLRNFPRDG